MGSVCQTGNDSLSRTCAMVERGFININRFIGRKYVHVSGKIRTCLGENTYMFFQVLFHCGLNCLPEWNTFGTSRMESPPNE